MIIILISFLRQLAYAELKVHVIDTKFISLFLIIVFVLQS